MDVLYTRISEFVDTFQKDYSVSFTIANYQVVVTLQKENSKQTKIYSFNEIIDYPENILLLTWSI